MSKEFDNSIPQLFDKYIYENTNSLIEVIKKSKEFKSNEEQIKYLSTVTKRDEFQNAKDIIDFTAFTKIVLLDLYVISKNLSQAKLAWEIIYSSKSAYTLIYEAIKTYNYINKKILGIMDEDIDFKKVHYEFSKCLREFKKVNKVDTVVMEIRGNIGAHIQKDIDTYYNTMQKIDVKSSYEKILSFIDLIYKMEKLCDTAVKIATKRILNVVHLPSILQV